MSQSPQAEVLHLAIETTAQSLVLEQENKDLRAQLKKNLSRVESFDVIAPRTQQLQQQLREKKAELESKQSELITLQSAIISNIKNPPPPSRSDESLTAIPIVMNRVQKNITALTDTAVAEKTISVPIISLFKVSEDLNRLFDALVEKGVIPETLQEKKQREQEYLAAQRQLLAGLKAIAQAARPPEPKVVEVDEPGQGDDEKIPRAPTPQSLPIVPVVDETEEMELEETQPEETEESK
jgi:hypothetical protein